MSEKGCVNAIPKSNIYFKSFCPAHLSINKLPNFLYNSIVHQRVFESKMFMLELRSTQVRTHRLSAFSSLRRRRRESYKKFPCVIKWGIFLTFAIYFLIMSRRSYLKSFVRGPNYTFGAQKNIQLRCFREKVYLSTTTKSNRICSVRAPLEISARSSNNLLKYSMHRLLEL